VTPADSGAPGAPGAHVSPQWAQWRARIDLDEYEARFVHATAHGEAELLVSFAPASVLDAGCGTGRVAIELHRRGVSVVGVDLDPDLLSLARAKQPDVTWVEADLATFELDRHFDVVALPGNVMLFCADRVRAHVVGRCAAHVAHGGRLVAGFGLSGEAGAITLDEYDDACTAAGLELEHRWSTWDRAPFDGGGYAVSTHVRLRRAV
jgi:SAM-dependent methyltransferase